MRNIAQYPITAQEAIDRIEAYGQAELASGAIGGIGPYITKLVAAYLKKEEADFKLWLDFQQKAVVKNKDGKIIGKQG